MAILSELHGSSIIGTIQGWGGAGFVPALVTGSAIETAVIADSVSGQLTYLSNISGGSPTAASVATAGLLQTPAGVGISPDGRWAFVADSAKPQVLRVSLSSAGVAPVSIACACKPAQLSSLTSNGIYVISSNVAGQPAWILDTRTANPRTFFVPAIATSANTQTASASTQAQPGRTSR
jgi:hypothetical protein